MSRPINRELDAAGVGGASRPFHLVKSPAVALRGGLDGAGSAAP